MLPKTRIEWTKVHVCFSLVWGEEKRRDSVFGGQSDTQRDGGNETSWDGGATRLENPVFISLLFGESWFNSCLKWQCCSFIPWPLDGAVLSLLFPNKSSDVSKEVPEIYLLFCFCFLNLKRNILDLFCVMFLSFMYFLFGFHQHLIDVLLCGRRPASHSIRDSIIKRGFCVDVCSEICLMFRFVPVDRSIAEL